MTDDEIVDGGLAVDDQDNPLRTSEMGENERYHWLPWNGSLEPEVKSVKEYIRLLGRRIFGDRYGLALFCAALAFYAFSWRIGFLITDSYSVANGFVAVSEGQIHIDRAVYGPNLETSGMYVVDGLVHTRNYGQIVLALPFLWIIQGIAAVADLRVALAGGFAVLLLGLSIVIGDLLDRDVLGRDSRLVGAYAGSVVALVIFAVVVRGATPIDPSLHHLLALQGQMMVAAALVGVVVYRLVNRMHGQRIGLAAGAAVLFVSPIGLWSSFPKRHVLVALGVVVSMYCLYRSREAAWNESITETYRVEVAGRSLAVSEMTRYRTLAYVPIGFVAWVNAFEGLILLAALLVVDVPTGGRRLRSLTAAWCTCVVSLVPMFVTNFIISGNPLEPPRAHGSYGSGGLAEQSGVGGGSGGGGGAAEGGSASSQTLESLLGALNVAWQYVSDGLSLVTSELNTLLYVFIRSGYVKELHNGGDALRLSFIETLPLAASLLILPIILWRTNVSHRLQEIVAAKRVSPVATVDIFVVVYSLLVALVFVPKFPMVAEITVRYLLVLFPLAIYGVARLSSVRRVITKKCWTCLSVYLTGVLVGGQLLFLALYASGTVVDESFQIHAYIGLAAALLVGGWILVEQFGYQDDRSGAIVLGLAAASGTVFIALARLWYFANIGQLALALV